MLSDAAKAELDSILTHYPDKRSALLPALYIAQREYGYLSAEAMREVASSLELDPTEVYSVVRFYSLFYSEPVGKYVIHVCEDLPCALRGAEGLIRQLEERLGIRVGETTPDGLFTLQTAMCLAGCDKAPLMQVNLEYEENLTPGRIDEILQRLRNEGIEAKGDE